MLQCSTLEFVTIVVFRSERDQAKNKIRGSGKMHQTTLGWPKLVFPEREVVEPFSIWLCFGLLFCFEEVTING